MALEQASGIILRTRDVHDADRGYTIYTDHFGKVQAWAQGVRRSSSKLAGHLEPLTHARVQFALGRHREKILQSVADESFPRIRSSWPDIVAAQACVEVTDQLTRVHAADVRVYQLLLATLRVLEQGAAFREQLYLGFLFKLFALTGFQPRVARCVAAPASPASQRGEPAGGRRPHGRIVSFSSARGGVLCADHAGDDRSGILLTAASHAALRTLLAEPLTTIAAAPFDRRVVSTLRRTGEQYRLTVTGGIALQSGRFFRSLTIA